jgi:photosystem II stability/assembly factor-like uncharacterized protein
MTVVYAAPPPHPTVIEFRDARHGLLQLGSGRIEATSDGGRTWRVVVHRGPLTARPAPLPPACERGWPHGAAAAAGRLVLAVCTREAAAGSQSKWVYRSRNGGRTWTLVAATPCVGTHGSVFGGISCYGYPSGIAVARDGFAVVLESRGTLFVSRDAGSHWHALRTVQRPDVDDGLAAAVLPGGVGYAVVGLAPAGPYRLVATRDAGRTWRVVHRWR